MKLIHAIAFGVVLSSCSSSESKTGPELCAEAGGQCVLGSAQCATRGDADCNPDRNPGGAFCCLSYGDGGPQLSDASTGAKTGPELCAEAGGQCVLGGVLCARRGDADCNPDLNPGGAFCCLSCGAGGPEPSDAGAPTCE